MVLGTSAAIAVISVLAVVLVAFVVSTAVLASRKPKTSTTSSLTTPAPTRASGRTQSGTQLAAVPEEMAASPFPSQPQPTFMVLCLTTIPPRFAGIDATITNLLQQTRPADAIVLSIPQRYSVRFKEGVPQADIDAFKQRFPTVVVHRPPADEGPGTKLLGALSALESWRSRTDPQAHAAAPSPGTQLLKRTMQSADTVFTSHMNVVLVLGDDDRKYPLDSLERFDEALRDPHNSNTALSGCVYKTADTIIGQGADLFAMPLRPLHAIASYFESLRHETACMYHDDLWISAYLALVGVQIQKVDIQVVNRDIANQDALIAVQGDLSRDTITRVAQQVIHAVNRAWRNKYAWLP